jgi:hypothetical protein
MNLSKNKIKIKMTTKYMKLIVIQTTMMKEKMMSTRGSSRTQSLTTRQKVNGKITNRV